MGALPGGESDCGEGRGAAARGDPCQELRVRPRRRPLALLLPAAACLCAALVSAPAVAGDGVSPVATYVDPFRVQAQGLRATGVYLHVSPALFALDVRSPGFQMWGWGLGAGRYWTMRERLAIAFGGFFEHMLWVNPYEHSWAGKTLNFLRFGPELRVGASNERAFAYGLARLGLDLLVGTPQTNLARMFVAEVGVGLQGALGKQRRLLLGVEPAFDVSVPAPWLLFRARAFVGVRF